MKNVKSIWGINSMLYQIANTNTVDENYVENYTGKVLSAQNNQLDSLKQDLAEWINKTLDVRYLNGDNIFQELDNGAILCHLAQVIKAKAKYAISAGLTKKPLPKMSVKYFENAMSGSFFSRDNMENFLKFCRSLGIHENLLFESDDLVLHTKHRNVILCLMEVARLSAQYGVEPPKLVQLEKEIENENFMQHEVDAQISWQFQSLPSRLECESLRTVSPSPTVVTEVTSTVLTPLANDKNIPAENSYLSLPHYSVVNNNENINTGKCLLKTLQKEDFFDYFERKMINETDLPFDELDKKVEKAVQRLHWNCRCPIQKYMRLKIKKIGKAKYNIAGRNIFVRLLKNCHMMVRIGGGWDTLEHFLRRLDPCQANGKYLRPQTVPNFAKKYTYFSTFNKILRPGESAV